MEQIWKTKETIWENAAEQKESLMKVPVEGVVGENGHRIRAEQSIFTVAL